jgi:leucyl aminopeptidase
LARTRQYEEFLVDELAGMGCGAIAAVTQGNAKGSDRLVKLTYRGRQSKTQGQGGGVTKSATLGQLYTSTLASTKESLRPVVLVGKGVCYDTGGVNVKSASSMKTMKHDMAGSAAALGVFAALSSTGCVTPVECWLVLAENNINGESYRPDDVVTALSGDTIEVVHSDAEGRMLLADVLAAASRKVPSRLTPDDGLVPRLVVDFATLTGTCITSLSNKYIGALSNRKEYASTVIAAGEKCGERVWPFPCDEDFDEDLKSDVADVLQCRQTTEADHIYAFAFLRRFVRPGVPWIHLDLGSAYRPGGLGHVPSDYTGAGVRLGWQLVHDITTTGEKDRSDF